MPLRRHLEHMCWWETRKRQLFLNFLNPHQGKDRTLPTKIDQFLESQVIRTVVLLPGSFRKLFFISSRKTELQMRAHAALGNYFI